MSAARGQLVQAAERLVLGASVDDERALRSTVLDGVDQLATDLERTDATRDWPRTRYLAALLDRAGLADAAETLLRRVADAANGLAVGAEANNLRAMLMIRNGRLDDGIQLLEDAFIEASVCGADVLGAVTVNLAVTHRIKGDDETAARWLDRCERLSRDTEGVPSSSPWQLIARGALAAAGIDGPGVSNALQQTVAAVREQTTAQRIDAVAAAEVARLGLEAGRLNGDEGLLRRSLDTLDVLAQLAGSVYDSGDTRTLMITANATVGEFELARLDSIAAMAVATRRLMAIADRVGDVLGANDPRSLALSANAVVATLEGARAERSWHSFEDAVRELERIAERQAAVLGPTHEQTLTSMANVACARIELAQRTASAVALDRATSALASTAAACAQGLGESHPVTLVLRQQLRLSTEQGSSEASGGVATRVRPKTRQDGGRENYSSFELAGQRLLHGPSWQPLGITPTTNQPQSAAHPESSPDEDEIWRIVGQAQAGDADAFGLIYDRYAATVFRFIYFRVGNRQLAEDLTSDTFLRALKRIRTFNDRSRDLGAWLVTIARNLVADHFKSGRYRLEVTAGDVLDPDRQAGDHETRPEGAAIDHITNVALLTAVKQLTPEQQEVIVLRFLQGFSAAETAQTMGRNEGAVRVLQYRAVRALARLLPDSFQP